MRYTFIDSIRGLAACAVTVFHLNAIGVWKPSLYQTVVDHGWLGVPAFFVVSGFVINESSLRAISVVKFLADRFWRIYPPYWCSLILVMIIIILRKLTSGTNDIMAIPGTVIGWSETVLLLIDPITDTKGVNWVYWSLTYEITFYLVLALFVLWPRLRWPAIGLLSLGSIWIFEPSSYFFSQWTLFGVGIAVSEFRRGHRAGAALLAALCVVDFVLNRSLPASLTGALTGLATLAATGPTFRWLNGEFLFSRVGVYSYSLYLTHVPIAVWIFLGVIEGYPRAASAESLGMHLVIDAGALLFALCGGYLFYLLIERRTSPLRMRRAGAEAGMG